jgi:uncharacterized protein
MLHYNSYSSHLKNRFGIPVAKIPINAGFSCPNRDGRKSAVGCFFCDNRAFSPVAVTDRSALEQLRDGIAKSGERFGAYIAYLQPYSNTYGDVARLRAVYEPLLTVEKVVGISLGTRPDCLTDEAYDYLADLAKRTYLCVELGLQSSHDTTLASVNRGHTYDDFRSAVEKLSGLGIETVAHVMIGLPGENEAMIFATADRLASLPLTGVKLHQLMIIRGTRMEQVFREGGVHPLSLPEYAALLSGFLERLRPDQLVHRIMADTGKEAGLIAPEWSAGKRESMAFLQEFMRRNRVEQGRIWRESAGKRSMSD